ncbi:DUF3459 domain-containing protein [Rhizomonospora bruguierae]|uniref:DUF3459 domain-containing protein n=1 Tax=Rhizomonospora bruguierae TaxID=1581705 RepID=UPI001BCE2C10|nr:DUF3459 domain-containing protein [Micromonospora sp. NBRC 107566]
MVFAGDELGLTGVNGEGSRTPMPWRRPGEWDGTTLNHYRKLIALRRRLPALRHPGLRWLHADDDAIAFVRAPRDEAVLVLARRAPGTPVDLGTGAGTNVYGGVPDLVPGTPLPGDGPTFQVWVLAAGA